MNKKNLLFVLIPFLIVGGLIIFSSSKSKSSQTKMDPSEVSITQPSTVDDNIETQITSTNYTQYSAEAVLKAAETGRVLLFFSASWCPTCRAAEEDIIRNNSKLPQDLSIFKTDYDTQKELKRRYGVTLQHTFVQIDAKGEEITKWTGGGVSEIVQNLKD